MSPILFLSIISVCPLAYYRGLHALSQALTATYPHIGKKKKKKSLNLAVAVFCKVDIMTIMDFMPLLKSIE